jgi:hypothetical protein
MPSPIPNVSRLTLVSSLNTTLVNKTVNTYNDIVPRTAASGFTAKIGIVSGAATITIFSAGSNYVVGDKIVFYGTAIGGTSTTNDLIYPIASVNSSGGVLTVGTIASGTVPSGTMTYYNVSSTVISSGYRVSVTNTDGIYTITNPVLGSDYAANTKLIVSGDLLGGLSPQNDFTFEYGTGTVPTNLTGDGAQDYSSVEFTLPSTYNNVIYMDWATSFGLNSASLMIIKQANGIPMKGVTTGGTPYWDFIVPNVLNNDPDRMAIKQWSPPVNIPKNSFLVELVDPSMKKVIQTTPWGIELLIFSI